MLFKVINWMMVLPEPYQNRYMQATIQLGKEQGRRQGALVLLERLLERRFGPLPKTIRHKLDMASLQQLGAWSDALPEAQSLREIFQ